MLYDLYLVNDLKTQLQLILRANEMRVKKNFN